MFFDMSFQKKRKNSFFFFNFQKKVKYVFLNNSPESLWPRHWPSSVLTLCVACLIAQRFNSSQLACWAVYQRINLARIAGCYCQHSHIFTRRSILRPPCRTNRIKYSQHATCLVLPGLQVWYPRGSGSNVLYTTLYFITKMVERNTLKTQNEWIYHH